jgi:hypothetical protein
MELRCLRETSDLDMMHVTLRGAAAVGLVKPPVNIAPGTKYCLRQTVEYSIFCFSLNLVEWCDRWVC